MMLIENKTFENHFDRDSASVFSDMELRHCRFVGSRLSQTEIPRLRSTVRNVRLIDCQVESSFVDTAIIEDVTVDGLRTCANPPFFTWGAVFKHVTLRGNIDCVVLSPWLATAITDPTKLPAQCSFDAANAAYYQNVDWALDISEGRFVEMDIRCIPARLIRRDPETQAVVKRERALEGVWTKDATSMWTKTAFRGRTFDLSKTWWPTTIQFMLDSGADDVVLVAPKRNRKFQQSLDGLKLLRDAGIAEPN